MCDCVLCDWEGRSRVCCRVYIRESAVIELVQFSSYITQQVVGHCVVQYIRVGKISRVLPFRSLLDNNRFQLNHYLLSSPL